MARIEARIIARGEARGEARIEAPGTLYVVATPIGDIGDITERARRVLAEADVIAAEDTRAAGLLLQALGIRGNTVSYHKFNERAREGPILDELARWRDVALVSDAGVPCVSDPGAIIVRAAAENGIRVVPVCGPSAVTAALSACGFEFDAFTFYGFLPRTEKDMAKLLNTVMAARANHVLTAVFFESPKRIKKSLAVFCAVLPDAELCLCNDLTKKYERVYRGNPREVLDELSSNPSSEKGEYTLVCQLRRDGGAAARHDLSPEAAIVDCLVKRGGTLKDAIRILSGGKDRAVDNGNTSNIAGDNDSSCNIAGDSDSSCNIAVAAYKRNELYAAAGRLKRLLSDGQEAKSGR